MLTDFIFNLFLIEYRDNIFSKVVETVGQVNHFGM